MSINLKDLPYVVHQELCRILDDGEQWRKLIKLMGFSESVESDITDVSRRTGGGVSPTCILLNRWIDRSLPVVHTSNKLFALLFRIRHVPALRCLVDYIDENCLQPDLRTINLQGQTPTPGSPVFNSVPMERMLQILDKSMPAELTAYYMSRMDESIKWLEFKCGNANRRTPNDDHTITLPLKVDTLGNFQKY